MSFRQMGLSVCSGDDPVGDFSNQAYHRELDFVALNIQGSPAADDIRDGTLCFISRDTNPKPSQSLTDEMGISTEITRRGTRERAAELAKNPTGRNLRGLAPPALLRFTSWTEGCAIERLASWRTSRRAASEEQ